MSTQSRPKPPEQLLVHYVDGGFVFQEQEGEDAMMVLGKPDVEKVLREIASWFSREIPDEDFEGVAIHASKGSMLRITRCARAQEAGVSYFVYMTRLAPTMVSSSQPLQVQQHSAQQIHHTRRGALRACFKWLTEPDLQQAFGIGT